MMIIGKGALMAASGCLTIIIIRNRNPSITQPFLPVVIVVIFQYLVASLFLSVFSFSSLAIMHCFINDEG